MGDTLQQQGTLGAGPVPAGGPATRRSHAGGRSRAARGRVALAAGAGRVALAAGAGMVALVVGGCAPATTLAPVGLPAEPSTPSPTPSPVATSLFVHCGLDRQLIRGVWYTLVAPAELKGMINPPPGWADSDGVLTVVEPGRRVEFRHTGTGAVLVYDAANPQPQPGDWVCS